MSQCSPLTILMQLGAALMLLAALPIERAEATPITYTFEGITTGTLETRPEYTTFADAPFTIIATADTANITTTLFTNGVFLYSLDTDSTTMAIEGIGSFGFAIGTRLFLYNNAVIGSGPIDFFGFGRAGIFGDPVFGFSGPMFATYGLATALGPVSGVLQVCCGALPTTFGGLSTLNFRVADVTFTAAIPEPSTYALMLAGLAAVAFAAMCRGRRCPVQKMPRVTGSQARAGAASHA